MNSFLRRATASHFHEGFRSFPPRRASESEYPRSPSPQPTASAPCSRLPALRVAEPPPDFIPPYWLRQPPQALSLTASAYTTRLTTPYQSSASLLRVAAFAQPAQDCAASFVHVSLRSPRPKGISTCITSGSDFQQQARPSRAQIMVHVACCPKFRR